MRVLIADDCAATRRFLSKCLTDWGYQAVAVKDGLEALQILQARFAPRLVVVDWMMPNMDGPTVCRKIRDESAATYSYVLMLTARKNPEDLAIAFEAGADDYLTKPFNAEELRHRLRAGQRVLELQDGLLATQDKLLFQATHDPLTGIYNRRAIIDSLTRELNRSHRSQPDPRSTSLILADLDRFKRVNDTFGHVAGDGVLQSVAAKIRNVLRSYDIFGRFGGEEFIVILPETGAGEAYRVAERLISVVAENPQQVGDEAIPVTVSCGVATSQQVGVEDRCIIRAADEALYAAKSAGRNCVRVAGPEALAAVNATLVVAPH